MKNLIDWLSRPLVAGDRQTPLAINGKKVALSGAGGASATARCREKLTELLTLPFIRAEVMTEPQTGIQLNREAWTEGRMILTEEQTDLLKSQVDAFIDFIEYFKVDNAFAQLKKDGAIVSPVRCKWQPAE